MKDVIAIDIGGTQLSSGIVSKEHQITHRLEQRTQSADGGTLFEQVIDQIKQTLLESERTIHDFSGIGLCVCGKVDPKRGIALFQHHLPWSNFPLVEKLSQHFPDIEIRLDNDMYAAGMAEYYTRKIPKDHIFVYCTLSTGTGIAIIQNGRLIRGHGYAGEIGYLPIYMPHRQEKFLYTSAGNGFKRTTRGKMEAYEIFEAASMGNEKAQKLIDEGSEGIAQMLHAVMCVLDPTCIVFGGSVSVKQPQYIQQAITKLAPRLNPEQIHVLDHIEISTLGSDNGLLGAAQLIFKKESR